MTAPPGPSQQAGDTGNLLIRSAMEIREILEAMAREGAQISAEFAEGEHLFLGRLQHVDPDGGFIIISYSQDKPGNAALLAAPSIMFHANFGGAHIQFAAAAPAEASFAGAAVIRLGFPKALAPLQRREQRRYPVPPEVPLRCVADSGGIIPFEAKIVDINLGGMGAMTYDPAIRLEPGTVLKACKIANPWGKPIVADLEVRHTVTMVLADGSLARRSGFSILGKPKGMKALLRAFVFDLGEGKAI